MEILSHDPEHVRLDWFNSGRAPFILEHYGDQLGAFKAGAAKLDDGKLRSTIRFSRSARAKEIADDMADDIRQNMSVGYRVFRYERAPELESLDPKTGRAVVPYWRAVDWEPYEASVVAIPADPTVGKGRTEDQEHQVEFVSPDVPEDSTRKTEPVTIEIKETTMPEITQDQIEKMRAEGAEAERVRQLEIRMICEKMHLKPELTEDFLRSGKDTKTVFQEAAKHWNPTQVVTIDPGIGMKPKDVNRYSLTRALLALSSGDWDKAGFEREVSKDAGQRAQIAGCASGGQAGLWVPHEVKMAVLGTRGSAGFEMTDRQVRANITAGVGGTEGSEFVGTENRGDMFIDVLRNRTAVIAAGATVLTDLQGNIAIPRQTAATAATISLTEVTAFTEGAPTFDQVSLSPKTVNSLLPISQQLLIQNSASVENIIRADIAKNIAVQIDAMSLNGSNSNGQPCGVKTTSGIGSTNCSETTVTWAEIVDAEKQISVGNADVATMRWLMNAKTRAVLKTTVKVASSTYPVYMWNSDTPEAPVNGYPVTVTNNCLSNLGTGTNFSECFLGNWSELMLGFWGGLFLLRDDYTLASTNLIRLVARQFFDVGIRHAISFGRMYGIPNS